MHAETRHWTGTSPLGLRRVAIALAVHVLARRGVIEAAPVLLAVRPRGAAWRPPGLKRAARRRHASRFSASVSSTASGLAAADTLPRRARHQVAHRRLGIRIRRRRPAQLGGAPAGAGGAGSALGRERQVAAGAFRTGSADLLGGWRAACGASGGGCRRFQHDLDRWLLDRRIWPSPSGSPRSPAPKAAAARLNGDAEAAAIAVVTFGPRSIHAGGRSSRGRVIQQPRSMTATLRLAAFRKAPLACDAPGLMFTAS